MFYGALSRPRRSELLPTAMITNRRRRRGMKNILRCCSKTSEKKNLSTHVSVNTEGRQVKSLGFSFDWYCFENKLRCLRKFNRLLLPFKFSSSLIVLKASLLLTASERIIKEIKIRRKNRFSSNVKRTCFERVALSLLLLLALVLSSGPPEMMKCGNKFLLRLRVSASDGMPASSASSKSNLGAGTVSASATYHDTKEKLRARENGYFLPELLSFLLIFFLPLASFLPSPSSGVGMKFRNWIINYPRFRREATVPDPPIREIV